jgi:hypothetical protein
MSNTTVCDWQTRVARTGRWELRRTWPQQATTTTTGFPGAGFTTGTTTPPGGGLMTPTGHLAGPAAGTGPGPRAGLPVLAMAVAGMLARATASAAIETMRFIEFLRVD